LVAPGTREVVLRAELAEEAIEPDADIDDPEAADAIDENTTLDEMIEGAPLEAWLAILLTTAFVEPAVEVLEPLLIPPVVKFADDEEADCCRGTRAPTRINKAENNQALIVIMGRRSNDESMVDVDVEFMVSLPPLPF
jgi:hypothetical protein